MPDEPPDDLRRLSDPDHEQAPDDGAVTTARRRYVAPPLGEAQWPPHLARPVKTRLLKGGWVGTTWLARLEDGTPAVVKQTPYPADLEVDGLTALARAGVPVPPVLGHAGGTLVLEPVDGPADWAGLGRAVAGMHQVTGDRFGWRLDNRAGRFVQPNPWTRDWSGFFAEHRVRAHLSDPGIPREVARRLDRACDGPLQALLPAHPRPALTHGDLWLGNTVAGRWVIDPEVSFADRELDLAYMEQSVKHPFPPPFWAAYRELLPFPDGYAERRPLLQLHHHLLQVRHFGDAALADVDRVLAHFGW